MLQIHRLPSSINYVQDGQVNVPVPQAGDGPVVHDVDAPEFQNMRLSIGTQGRTMLDISLSENLDDTRNIEVRLRQENGPEPVQAPEQGDEPVINPDQQPHGAARRGKLKITVTAEHDADKEFLEKMRGWLMTVATLFVNMAFQAVLHPPDWLLLPPGNAQQQDTVKVPEYRNFRTQAYLVCSTSTFAISLALVTVLLLKSSSARLTLTAVTVYVSFVSLFLAFTFALSTFDDWKIIVQASVFMLMYAGIAILVSIFLVPIGRLVGRLVGH